MLASNSVSTIFRCMSCSFGTRDQTTYAEHIKHCSNESTSETLPVASDGEEVRNNSLNTVKNSRNSRVCTECHLSTSSSRELLLHLRDVHGKDIRIFVCKFCSNCASQHARTICRHARNKHTERSSKRTQPYIELHRESVIEKSSANNEASADVSCISAVQTESCEKEGRSIPNTIISSKSLGLHFLGRQLRDSGRDEFVCVLCSYSHVVSNIIVKHIWKDHKDKVSEVSAAQTTESASMTNVIYKCDDCSYSTSDKFNFYNHCSHHQFSGPSQCPYCSFCALTDGAVNQHIRRYHPSQHLKCSTNKPKSIHAKISTPCKVTKTGGNSPCKKLYAQQQQKKKWFECPHCPFKSKWCSSVYMHKVRVHPELGKKCRTVSTANSMCSSPELKKVSVTNTVEMNADSFKAEHRKPPTDRMSSNTTSTPSKKNVYKCDVCSSKCKSLKHLHSHKLKHLDIRPYQCPLCGLRSNYLPNTQAHIRNVHNNSIAKGITLSLENAKQTIEAYKKQFFVGKSKKSGIDNAVEVTYSCNKTGQQNPPDDQLFLDDRSKSLRQNMYKCDMCSAKLRSVKALKTHKKMVHFSFGCYQCSLCGFRSNYSQNTNIHICRVHGNENATTIKLSLEDAKQTIEAYRKQHFAFRRYQCPICGLRTFYMESMQTHIHNVHKDEKAKAIILSLEEAKQTNETRRNKPVKLSHSWHKRLRCTASVRRNKLLHPAVSGKSRALQYSISSPNNETMANSSKSSLIQSTGKQPRLDNAETSHSNIPSLKKRYACSLCKFQSCHNSSIYRHIHNVHRGRQARLITVKGNMSVHQSKVAVQCQQSVDNREHNDTSGAKFAIQNITKSDKYDMPANEVNVHPKNEANSSAPVQLSPRKRSFVCDICPHRSTSLRDLTSHRKLHVKRSGYSFACNICPYFACQAATLERHKKVHAAQSTDVEKKVKVKPDEEVHRQKSVHSATYRFFCDYCPYMTYRERTFIYHRQLHRSRILAQIKCEHCDFWVAEPWHLHRHQVVHTAAYIKKRMQCSPMLHTLPSLGNDVTETAYEKDEVISLHFSASGDVGELEKITVTADEGKLHEMSQNMSVNDDDECTVNIKRVAGATEENIDTSAQSRSSGVNRQLPSWCCERCPYVSNRLACFKRHVWLHGKHYPYECRYCDYSVESYWQLVSHVLWHFAPNKHLVYAQPVSNLDSFSSQLPNRDSVPDSVASIDRFIPSFENSDVFLLSDASNFQCQCCPFVTEQRSEFFSHMLCHCVRNAALYSCPFCNFHTDLQERLSAHVFLHFNLPGCRQSSLPPHTCHSDDWKQLDAAIEALTEKNTHHTEPHCVPVHDCNNLRYGFEESLSSLNGDSLTTENQTTRPSDCDSDSPVEKCVSMLRAVHSDSDSTHTLSFVPQPAVSNMHTEESASSDQQHANVTYNTVLADGSREEQTSSAKDENVTLATQDNLTKFCRYCDRLIDDPAALSLHEARHVVGCYQQLPSLGKILLYFDIY